MINDFLLWAALTGWILALVFLIGYLDVRRRIRDLQGTPKKRYYDAELTWQANVNRITPDDEQLFVKPFDKP